FPEIGWVVDGKPRLHLQDFVEGQRNSALVADVAGDEDIGAAAEDDAHLAARRGDVVSSQRMIRMIDIVNVAVPHTSREGHATHDAVALEGATEPHIGSELS